MYGLEVLLGLTHIVFKASSLKNLSNVFLSPFPKPNNTTKIKIPKATVKPERKVLSLFFLIVSNISSQRSLLNIYIAFIILFFLSSTIIPSFNLTILEHILAISSS